MDSIAGQFELCSRQGNRMTYQFVRIETWVEMTNKITEIKL
jgi:hypothetical protein